MYINFFNISNILQSSLVSSLGSGVYHLRYELNAFVYKLSQALPRCQSANTIKTDEGYWSPLDYLFLHTDNDLKLLATLLSIVAIAMLISHIYDYQQHKKNRAQLPLVIGGWGTRGKTGTERLKAAIFAHLGMKIVAKTTGCETTITIVDYYRPSYTIPLFRPFQKATIVEQRNITKFASNFGAEILLWECMALRSNYVTLLQDNWMRDDLSTITNAFPDHEDIQGPSGIDVAESIASFIRQGGKVLTSEIEMLPILKNRAREQNAKLHVTDWMEQGFLTEDIMAMFPYLEHPANIALVLRMAEELGIDRRIALYNMVNKVNPEIGALKTFHSCDVAGRVLLFSNSMSANDEAAALNNWQRLGFSTCRIKERPSLIISALINNRIDRTRRTHVFAELIPHSISAEYYFLIGTNLKAMRNYMIKAWQLHVDSLIASLKPDVVEAAAMVKEFFYNFRVCVDEETLQLRQQSIIKNEAMQGAATSEKFLQRLKRDFAEYQAIQQAFAAGSVPNKEIVTTLRRIFAERIIIIDCQADDIDKIFIEIIQNTPPGFTNHLFGMQNIKTPGIEFIRAWQQWEECQHLCHQLKHDESASFEDILEQLAMHHSFSILSCDYVKQQLEDFLNTAAGLGHAAVVHNIMHNLEQKGSKVDGGNSIIYSFFKYIGVHDIMNIYRNWHQSNVARAIYNDLITRRISLARARIELTSAKNRI